MLNHTQSQRISVIIPVYNGEYFLAEAIQSVLDQILPPDEIIVVDDGSTDGSAQVAADLIATTAAPICYCHQENCGPSAARNHGLTLATGEIIAFLDADDVWDSDKLAIQMPLLMANAETQIVWGRVQEFRTEGQQRITLGAPHPGPHVGAALMRRTAFATVGGYDETRRHGEDLDWFLRSRELRLPAITHSERVLWYRHHDHNTWLGKQDTFSQDLTAFVKQRLERRRAAANLQA